MAAQGSDLVVISRGGVNYKLTLAEIAALASAGAIGFSTVEVDLGAAPSLSGSFTIPGAGLTVGKPVLIQQAAGPYTGKGDHADEAEGDQVNVTAVVTAADTITAYWNSPTWVLGAFRFTYLVGA